jgi:hypothetical protein
MRLYVEVLKPRSLLKLSPRTWGPKKYSGLQSHIFTSLLTESRVSKAWLLYLPSLESWVATNPGPNSQHPGFKLLTGVPTVKEPNGKKKPSAGRAAPKCVEPRE